MYIKAKLENSIVRKINKKFIFMKRIKLKELSEENMALKEKTKYSTLIRN